MPGVPPGKYLGLIKSFNAEKGFGFIDCPESYIEFGRDVFIHKREIRDYSVGTEVTFAISTNQDGRPQARDTRRHEPYGALPPYGAPPSYGAPHPHSGHHEPKAKGRARKKAKAKAKAAGPSHAPTAPPSGTDAQDSTRETPPGPSSEVAHKDAPAENALPTSTGGAEAPAAEDVEGEGDFNCDAESEAAADAPHDTGPTAESDDAPAAETA